MMRLLQKSLKVPGKMGGQINELKSHSKRENTRIYGVSAGTARELPSIRPCTRQIERRAHRLLALWPPPCSIIVKFFKLQNESGSAPLAMAEEGTHLARKSHSIGPLRSTAHPPKKRRREYTEVRKVLKENQIQFQSLHPVGACVRYEDGAKIYESTEEVTEDSVGRGYTLIIEPSESLMEQVQWEWNRLESGCSLQAEASRLRTSLTPSRQHDSRNLSSRLELT